MKLGCLAPLGAWWRFALLCQVGSALLLRNPVESIQQRQPAAQTANATPQTHSKVDVGFTDFERNLTAQVDAIVKQIATSGRWTSQMQAQLAKNMTDSVRDSLKATLKPLKFSIGKTWMALPQDAQKDAYVNQLRDSFTGVFAEALLAAEKHLRNSVKHAAAKQAEKLSQADLLLESEQDLADRLLVDHCYALDEKKAANASRSKLCMKSVLHAMTHRLNDTLGLISMTMRFDAGAMSLAQKNKGGSLLQNSTSEPSQPQSKCSQAGGCEGVWDGKAVAGSDGKHVCSWKHMVPGWYLNGGKAPEMCLRNYPDFVSDRFKAAGTFESCLDLAKAWQSLPDGSKSAPYADRLSSCDGQCSAEHGTKPGIYVDVGANIGTCVMQMLARPDVAQVVAFEPSPANLFYMTSSIAKRIGDGDPRIMKNLLLYPKALGAEKSMHKLYEQPGNAGNTGVDTTVMGEEMKGVSVETITLDEVFMSGSSPPYIHLMKLDAQGYEVKILNGGKRLLASGAVNAIHIEVAPWWLVAQQTSVREYLSILHVNMYDLRPAQSTDFFSTSELAKVACDLGQNGTLMDMIALRNHTKGALPRAHLQCP